MTEKIKNSENVIKEDGKHDEHYLPNTSNDRDSLRDSVMGKFHRTFYDYADLIFLQEKPPSYNNYISGLSAIDELLERDRQRSEDGFPKKIRLGRFVKPGKGGKNKIIIVPSTVEEKFIHDTQASVTGAEGKQFRRIR